MRRAATSAMTPLSGALIVDCGEVTSTKLRCVRLLQWMCEGECIDLHASFKNFPHSRVRLKVATVKHHRARQMRVRDRYRQWWAHRRSKTVLFADHLRA